MKALSQEEKRRKLRELARDGGHASVVEMFKACVTDSVSPAICTDARLLLHHRDGARSGSRLLRGVRRQYRRLGSRARRPHLRRAEHAVPQLLPVRHMRPRMD